jgi:hypothetical protein
MAEIYATTGHSAEAAAENEKAAQLGANPGGQH